MKQLRIHRHLAHHRAGPGYTPRLELRPKDRPAEYLDGAWWPRSTDLVTELPDLLAVLAVRLGPVHRIVYDQRSWLPAPGRIAIDGVQIQLDAFSFELGNTMYVLSGADDMLVLQVIASTADPDIAHTTLRAAVARRPRPGVHDIE
ncbi:DUF5994 family protein [Nocardia sp. NPDC059246]|uniref:DUF5994 family protein n=1 Tax=unclassified Nocardia TaxID=2637762 RepID=UPI003696F4E8